MFPTHLSHLYPNLPYHNLEHTKGFHWESCPSEEAYWAAAFHDIVYDPRSSTNEEDSITQYDEKINSITNNKIDHNRVHGLIRSTKDHVKYYDSSPDMDWLHRNDLACFRSGADVITNEKNIFREFQFVQSFHNYKQERFKILNKFYKHPLTSHHVLDSINNFLDVWEPKYALYAGSFNPWHRGHADVLRQAEQIFDKVIIAQGRNEDKSYLGDFLDNVDALRYHHTERYEGSLFKYLNDKQEELGNLTLIRGLRNADDLSHETVLFNFGQDFTDVPFAYFLSKSANAHISSSAVRKLDNLGLDTKMYL